MADTTYQTQFIAEFGKNTQDGGLEVNVRNATETGAVNNRLEMKGGCYAFTNYRLPELKMNDANFGSQQWSRGMNVRIIDASGDIPKISDSRAYDLYGDPAVNGKAMSDFLDNLAPGLIAVLMTHDAIRSTLELDEWMNSKGANMWAGRGIYASYYRSAYVAVYLGAEKRFCMDAGIIPGNETSPNEDLRPTLETVIDKTEDIGSTGFNHLVYDGDEYSAGVGTFQVKYYPENKVVLSDVGLKAGDSIRIEWEQSTSKDGMDAGMKGMMSCGWFDASGVWVQGERVYQTKADVWERMERRFIIPSNTRIAQFQAIFYRGDTDGNKGKAGVMSVRNCVVSQTTKEASSGKNAQMGLYGFRTNKITNNIEDSAINRLLMQLPDPSTQPEMNFVVPFNSIGEKEKATVPLIVPNA